MKTMSFRGGGVLLAGVLLVAAGAVWWAAGPSPTTAGDAVDEPAGSVLQRPGEVSLPIEIASRDLQPAALMSASTESGDAPLPDAGMEFLDETTRVTWRGRVVHADGRPEAGVPWQLTATEQAAEWPPGRDTKAAVETTQAGTTDADGRFAAHFASPPATSTELSVLPAGFVSLVTRDRAPFAPRDRDFGDIVLNTGASLEGTIVDADGRLVPGPWQVHAYAAQDIQSASVWQESSVPAIDATSGRFVATGLLPGPHDVHANLVLRLPGLHLSSSLWRQTIRVDVGDAEQSPISFRYDGPDLARLVPVFITAPPGRPCPPIDAVVVTLSGRGLGVERLTPMPSNRHGVLYFVDVAPGAYTLEVHDPGYLPWRRDGVQPGDGPVLVELVGSSALTLVVVDAASGQPVETFAASATAQRTSALTRPLGGTMTASGRDVPVAALELHAGGAVRIDGLPTDVSLALTVDAPGYVPFKGTWAGALPGMPQTFTAALTRAGGVSGRVVRADGTPAARVEVGLFSIGSESDPLFINEQDYWRLDLRPDAGCIERCSTRTDDEGRFQLDAADLQQCFLRAWRSPVVEAFVKLELKVGEAIGDLELVLLEGVDLPGRLVEGDEAPRTPWALALAPAGDASLAARTLPVTAAVAADGSWRAQQLVPGAWDVFALPAQAWGSDWLPLRAYLDAADNEHVGRYDLVAYAHHAACTYLGRIDLPWTGTEPPSFDVADDRPGEVHVRVLAQGIPVPGIQVELTRAGAPDDGVEAFAVTDVTGLAVLARALPGTLVVTLREPSIAAWGMSLKEITTPVRAGEIVALDVPIDRSEGTLLCLDAASGAPLADTVVGVWRHDGSDWRALSLRTDAEGRLALAAPRVELRVAWLGAKADALAPRPDKDASDVAAMHALMEAVMRGKSGAIDTDLPRAISVTWSAPAETVVRLAAPPD